MKINHDTSFLGGRRLELRVCLFLILTTLVAYWQLQYCDFVNFDDHLFITQNSRVQDGLTWHSFVWSFTSGTWVSNLWHPLTWLSHLLDVQLFGMNPGGHHLSSLLFHLANTLVLFFVLKRMTGALWKSAFVAALFALHPLHVESVAWVSERKDVLSTLFWLLAMGSYCHYAQQPGFLRYLGVLLLFVLGLMSKPMLITLPFVFLLMDYWPLGRLQWGQTIETGVIEIRQGSLLRLVGEKIPLFVLSAVASAVIFITEKKGGGVAPLDMASTKIHVANALISYSKYLGKMVWPSHLAVFYPYPMTFPNVFFWKAAGSALLLAGLTAVFVWAGRKYPYLIVGWLWYLGTLVPVIGFVQAGSFAMADRYTYVTLIGVFIMIAWGVGQCCSRRRHAKPWLFGGAAVLLLALTAATWIQVGYWKNSMTLFEHALKVTSNNYVAHNGVGVAMKNQGRIDQAMIHYLEALRIKPGFEETHNNLGFIFYLKKDIQKAIEHYQEALRIKPHFAKAHSNLGVAMETEGRTDEAIHHFSEALRLQPNAGAHVNLGVALFRKGDVRGAARQYIAALHLKPDSVDAHYNLGVALERVGQTDEAARAYLETLRIQPDNVGAHNNLGILLEKQGRLDEAIDHYLQALRIMPDFEEAHNNLGIALFRKGDIQGAIDHFREALRIEPDNVYAKDNLKRALMAQQQQRSMRF